MTPDLTGSPCCPALKRSVVPVARRVDCDDPDSFIEIPVAHEGWIDGCPIRQRGLIARGVGREAADERNHDVGAGDQRCPEEGRDAATEQDSSCQHRSLTNPPITSGWRL